MLLSSLLAGLAAALVVQPPAQRSRLAALSPLLLAPGRSAVTDPQPAVDTPGPHGQRARPGHLARSGWSAPVTACAVAGLAAFLLVGGAAGAALAAVLVLAGPRALARLPARADKDRAAALTRDLPLALDLLAACLAGGAPLQSAVPAVADAVGGECGTRLHRVASALSVGSPPADAWAHLADGVPTGSAGPASRALARAGETGAPVAAAVGRAAADARVQARAASTEAARRAGVYAVAPLGLCFLPAFVLLGVVPVVIGLAGPLISAL